MIRDVLHCIRSDILWDSWIFFRLINSAQKIHKEAELNESLGDDERAYILYMKYFNVVTLARKLPDYKKQKVVGRQLWSSSYDLYNDSLKSLYLSFKCEPMVMLIV